MHALYQAKLPLSREVSKGTSYIHTHLINDNVSQIGYSTVFFWEYFGPLVVYPLFFFLPHFLYPGQK